MTDDELEHLLGPKASAGTSGTMSAELLERTQAVLWRAQIVRRTFTVLGVVLLMGLSAAVGWLAQPEKVSVEIVRTTRTTEPTMLVPSFTADQLEQQAELANDPAIIARLYAEAGDKHLNDRTEPGEAARCYRLSLQAGGKAHAEAKPTDTWLFAEMKSQFQRQENRRVSTNR
jgi:hypothetical protein